MSGIFSISLGFVILLMKNWWIKKLIKMRDGEDKSFLSNLFKQHMKFTTPKKMNQETIFAAIVAFVLGFVMILWL
jgi:hypothetical protein